MKYITGIRLINYTRFRGTHELELEPGVYAVVAQDENDPDRSNWLGKSAFVHSIVYALFGAVHGDNVDSVVTEGEDEGGVELEFDDGSFISRRRTRGKRTQVELYTGDDDPLVGEAADTEILFKLAQSYEDFKQTCFFEQGSMSNVIDEGPAARTARISGWMSLDLVQEAHAVICTRVRNCVNECEHLNSYIEVLEKTPAQHDYDCSLEDWLSAVDERFKRLSVEWGKDCAIHERCEERRYAWRAEQNTNAKVRERNGYQEELDSLVICEEKQRPDDELLAVRGKLWKAEETRRQLHEVNRGKFDGKCPVNGGKCPIVDEMNQGCDETAIRYEEQCVLTGKLNDEAYKLHQQVRSAADHNRHALDTKLRAKFLQEQIDKLKGLQELHRPEPPMPPEVDDFELRSIEKLEKTATAAVDKYKEVQGSLEELGAELKTLRIAALVLGREGVQRHMMQGAMTDVEARANAALGRVGVPLELSVQWGKELGKPAEECSACGLPFPRSARVKECMGCGAIRGKACDGKLYLRLSAVSGAAKDLGGIAFRLAGARWLAEARASEWGVVVLDEPMGQLDRHNSRAMASSFRQLLDDGFMQAFVIAHDRSTLDALPRRIQITGRGKYSEVQVV